jgi:PAS domain S-box-containing protein
VIGSLGHLAQTPFPPGRLHPERNPQSGWLGERPAGQPGLSCDILRTHFNRIEQWEVRLLESDATILLNELTEMGPFGFIAVNAQGSIEMWSPGAERILGWSKEELLGHPPPPEFQRLDLNAGPVERQARQKDGRVVDLDVYTRRWHDLTGSSRGMLIVLVDATARRAAENMIRDLMAQGEQSRSQARADRRFRELLEAAPDAIIEVDRDGRILLLNKVTENLFGYSRDELLGQAVEILIPDALRKGHVDHRSRYWDHPQTRPMGTGLKLEGQRKDGSRFPIEISLSPVKFEDSFRVTAIIRDVSERYRSERQLHAVQAQHTEELAAKNRELEARNREAEEANRLKTEFLTGMSHELRTPLHTILGFAELLSEELEGPLNEKQKRFITHIQNDSTHLLALINDLLDLSKIEAGRLELKWVTLLLSEVLQEAVSSVRPQGQAKSVAIEILVDHSLQVHADRLRLKQILFNLLSNAVKFTPERGKVTVDAECLEGYVHISVTDTGIGIPEDKLESIFDKFYQIGRKVKDSPEGTGLGLAITRQLVKEHGGSIQVQSTPGKGTRFTFTIPALAQVESAG